MRVGFRRVSARDLKRLNEIVNDPAVARFINLIPPVSMESTRDFFLECRRKKSLWYCVVVDGTIAGSVHLAPRTKNGKMAHVAEFGISLAKEYWGMGLGGRAIGFIVEEARKRRLKRIEFWGVADNMRARGLYKRKGFVEEGRNKKSFIIDGKYHDTIMMARLLK